MKVIFVSEPLFPLGGTSSRTINLAQALVNKGHDVHIITPREDIHTNRSIKEVKIVRLKAFMPQSFGKYRVISFLKFILRGGLFQIMSEIVKLYDSNESTIVHYVNYYMSICGLIIDKLLKIKSIHDIQASAFLESTNKLDGIIKMSLEKLCASSKNIMFITYELQKYFIGRYFLINKKTYVIPHTIDIYNYSVNNDIRNKIESSNNFKHLVVYHGAPYQANIKALRIIKKIVEKLNDEGLDCKALILGFVGKYVTSPHFITCGYVDNLESYISAADLAILPLDKGSFGMHVRILDYMSCGVPVIAYYDGLSGYRGALEKKALLAPRDINELIKMALYILVNPSVRHEIKINAIKYIKDNHSPKTIAVKLESVYKEVLGN